MRWIVDARRAYVCDRVGVSLPGTPPRDRPDTSARVGPLAHRGPPRAHGALPAFGRELQGSRTRNRPPGPTSVGTARTGPTRGVDRRRAASVRRQASGADT